MARNPVKFVADLRQEGGIRVPQTKSGKACERALDEELGSRKCLKPPKY
jgi:hypothetical protein